MASAWRKRLPFTSYRWRPICGRDGIRWYYSLQSQTETYAAILVSKADSPLGLIAQVVRDNSRRYPRPVPAESFREAPFELSGEEMSECLKALGTGGRLSGYRADHDLHRDFVSLF